MSKGHRHHTNNKIVLYIAMVHTVEIVQQSCICQNVLENNHVMTGESLYQPAGDIVIQGEYEYSYIISCCHQGNITKHNRY